MSPDEYPQFDHKEQSNDRTSKAGKPDEMVATLSEQNEEHLRCQESLTVALYEGRRVTHSSQNKKLAHFQENGSLVLSQGM